MKKRDNQINKKLQKKLLQSILCKTQQKHKKNSGLESTKSSTMSRTEKMALLALKLKTMEQQSLLLNQIK